MLHMEEQTGDLSSNNLSFENEDSLDWAKKAYEKLKLEQENKKKEILINEEKDNIRKEISQPDKELNQLSKSDCDQSNDIIENKIVDTIIPKVQEDFSLGDFHKTFLT